MSLVGAKPRLYIRPHRELALEAAIVAALARGPIAGHELRRFVQEHLPWATIGEVHATKQVMIGAGRVVEVRQVDRSIPLFTLPETPAHAHDAAPPAAPRDLAVSLPA